EMAALLDPEMFEQAERDWPRWLSGDPEALVSVVTGSVAAKLRVVEIDPEERLGARQLLNFGHTLGHAIEKRWGYGAICHGEAIAYGILFALRLARRVGVLEAGDEDLAARLRSLLRGLQLPDVRSAGLGAKDLMASMGQDKKATEAGLTWVLPAALGRGVRRTVDGEIVRSELEAFLVDPWAPAAA
ncbi:MAG: hypothetical protein AAF725_28025, partial [Acidobacteriota bacterium]